MYDTQTFGLSKLCNISCIIMCTVLLVLLLIVYTYNRRAYCRRLAVNIIYQVNETTEPDSFVFRCIWTINHPFLIISSNLNVHAVSEYEIKKNCTVQCIIIPSYCEIVDCRSEGGSSFISGFYSGVASRILGNNVLWVRLLLKMKNGDCD